MSRGRLTTEGATGIVTVSSMAVAIYLNELQSFWTGPNTNRVRYVGGVRSIV